MFACARLSSCGRLVGDTSLDSLPQIQGHHRSPVPHVELRSDQCGRRPGITLEQWHSPANLHPFRRQRHHCEIPSFIQQDHLPISEHHIDFSKGPVLPGHLACFDVDGGHRRGSKIPTRPVYVVADANRVAVMWGPGNLLFISSAYNGGARVLHLAQSGGKTKVEELWSSNRMRVQTGV